jgi:glycosyltransferase involved in cell wall biosynthesis
MVLSPDAPFPPVGGGQLRIHHLLRALATRHDLTLVAFNWGAEIATPPFPVRVVEVPWTKPLFHEQMVFGDQGASQAAYAQLAADTEEPFLVSYYQSQAMGETLRRVAGASFDLIVIENSFMARFLGDLPAAIPKVLALQNVLTLMEQRRADDPSPEERARADVARTLKFERWAAAQCDVCLVVSEQEAKAARSLLGVERVQVVPNGVDTRFFAPTPGSGKAGYILFTGSMIYRPNVRAVQHFSREILPTIRSRYPMAQFHIVGSSPTKDVKDLASDHVTVHGAVPDMRPYYADAEIVVAPLLDGGGTRLKILEAAACGKAIVSTSIGAEGLEFRSRRDILLADSADEFSAAVVGLMKDEPRRDELGRHARATSLPYDWANVGVNYCRIINEFLAPGERASTQTY